MLAATVLAVAGAGCGGGSTRTGAGSGTAPHKPSRRHHRAAAAGPVTFTYHRLFSLSAPLRDPASAVLAGTRFALLGGLDAADVSSAGIEVADPHRLLSTARLPLAQHDAQGAALNGKVYVFGGGSFSELDHIIRFDPASGTVQTVGSLPRAQSDVAVTATGGTAYIVGGYDGTNWLNTILAWRPGTPVHVAGHLPVGLRYSSASAIGGEVVIIGGSTPSGASDAIYRFDPADRSGPADRPPRAPEHPRRRRDARFQRVSGWRPWRRVDLTDRPCVVDQPAVRRRSRRGPSAPAAVRYGGAAHRRRHRRGGRPVAVGHGDRGGRAGAAQRLTASRHQAPPRSTEIT